MSRKIVSTSLLTMMLLQTTAHGEFTQSIAELEKKIKAARWEQKDALDFDSSKKNPLCAREKLPNYWKGSTTKRPTDNEILDDIIAHEKELDQHPLFRSAVADFIAYLYAGHIKGYTFSNERASSTKGKLGKMTNAFLLIKKEFDVKVKNKWNVLLPSGNLTGKYLPWAHQTEAVKNHLNNCLALIKAFRMSADGNNIEVIKNELNKRDLFEITDKFKFKDKDGKDRNIIQDLLIDHKKIEKDNEQALAKKLKEKEEKEESDRKKAEQLKKQREEAEKERIAAETERLEEEKKRKEEEDFAKIKANPPKPAIDTEQLRLATLIYGERKGEQKINELANKLKGFDETVINNAHTYIHELSEFTPDEITNILSLVKTLLDNRVNESYTAKFFGSLKRKNINLIKYRELLDTALQTNLFKENSKEFEILLGNILLGIKYSSLTIDQQIDFFKLLNKLFNQNEGNYNSFIKQLIDMKTSGNLSSLDSFENSLSKKNVEGNPYQSPKPYLDRLGKMLKDDEESDGEAAKEESKPKKIYTTRDRDFAKDIVPSFAGFDGNDQDKILEAIEGNKKVIESYGNKQAIKEFLLSLPSPTPEHIVTAIRDVSSIGENFNVLYSLAKESFEKNANISSQDILKFVQALSSFGKNTSNLVSTAKLYVMGDENYRKLLIQDKVKLLTSLNKAYEKVGENMDYTSTFRNYLDKLVRVGYKAESVDKPIEMIKLLASYEKQYFNTTSAVLHIVQEETLKTFSIDDKISLIKAMHKALEDVKENDKDTAYNKDFHFNSRKTFSSYIRDLTYYKENVTASELITIIEGVAAFGEKYDEIMPIVLERLGSEYYGGKSYNLNGYSVDKILKIINLFGEIFKNTKDDFESWLPTFTEEEGKSPSTVVDKLTKINTRASSASEAKESKKIPKHFPTNIREAAQAIPNYKNLIADVKLRLLDSIDKVTKGGDVTPKVLKNIFEKSFKDNITAENVKDFISFIEYLETEKDILPALHEKTLSAVGEENFKRYAIDEKIQLMKGIKKLYKSSSYNDFKKYSLPSDLVKRGFDEKAKTPATEYITYINGLIKLGESVDKINSNIMEVTGWENYKKFKASEKISLLDDFQQACRNVEESITDGYLLFKSALKGCFDEKKTYSYQDYSRMIISLSSYKKDYYTILKASKEALSYSFPGYTVDEKMDILIAMNNLYETIKNDKNNKVKSEHALSQLLYEKSQAINRLSNQASKFSGQDHINIIGTVDKLGPRYSTIIDEALKISGTIFHHGLTAYNLNFYSAPDIIAILKKTKKIYDLSGGNMKDWMPKPLNEKDPKKVIKELDDAITNLSNK